MTRDDLRRFRALDIDFGAVGLLQDGGEDFAYFCTPVDAEYVGRIGCDGVHFVLLPGDEQVFCVDPAMGEEGKYVLPVGEDFREFLSFLLYSHDANALSQIWWMDEARFREMLRQDAEQDWPGCDMAPDPEYLAKNAQALAEIARAFGLTPADPFGPVKAMQAAFDPSVLRFSDEYYDILGLENPWGGTAPAGESGGAETVFQAEFRVERTEDLS